MTCWGTDDKGDEYGQISGMPDHNDWVDVDLGSGHSVGLRADGTLECWGRTDKGQCDVPSDLVVSTGAPECTSIANCAGDVTCTDATDSVCSSCEDGFYGDTCAECTSVANCAGDVTCTDETDSVCSSCEDGFYGDTCTAPTLATTIPTTTAASAGCINVIHTTHPTGDTGKYFYFELSDWPDVDGCEDGAGCEFEINQFRADVQIRSGTVIVWNNENGVHGRFSDDPQAGDFQVDDLIETPGGSCAPQPGVCSRNYIA